MIAPNDTPALDYAPVPGRWRRRATRRWMFAMVVVIALAAIVLPLKFVRELIGRNRLIAAAHQIYLRSTAPADTVAYDETPDGIARLERQDAGTPTGEYLPIWSAAGPQRRVALWYYPKAIRSVQAPFTNSRGMMDLSLHPSGGVFLHARRNGRGQRLVSVSADFVGRRYLISGVPLGENRAILSAVVTRPGSTFAAPRTLWDGGLPLPALDATPAGELRLYVGQPDPDDESHFTIDYETRAGRGAIDGWLMPDDTVRLRIRDGPAKER